MKGQEFSIMTNRLVYSNRVDPVAKRFLEVGSECINYIKALSSVIKKEYVLGNIDLKAYERQINLLTAVLLQLEHIELLSKESLNNSLGVFINERI